MMLQMAGHIPAEANDRVRQDLALKLWAYYSERGQYAVLEPGAREKAILYQGTQRRARRSTWRCADDAVQAVPDHHDHQDLGTEIAAAARGWTRSPASTELIVGTTLAGALANFLNQTAKGQDPTAQWKNQPGQALLAAFLRGGAASIYGDYLLGEFSRTAFQRARLAGRPDARPDQFRRRALQRPQGRCLRQHPQGLGLGVAGAEDDAGQSALHEHDLHPRRVRLPDHVPAAGMAQSRLSAAHGAGHEAVIRRRSIARA
jgi:hypothetical protein